jgi:ribonuclease HI
MGRLGVGSQMVQHVMISAIIHVIWIIWRERNNRYFSDKAHKISSLIHSIIAEVKLAFEFSMIRGSSAMTDFQLSQLFGIPLKYGRIKTVIDVHWQPPDAGWIKVNCDGSSMGISNSVSIGFVFRDADANFKGAFTQNIGYATSLEAEFCSCMLAIEKAIELNFSSLCIETDSLMAVKAYPTSLGIPWRLKARWINCLQLCAQIDCKFTHTLREGNIVADSLSKNGQGLAPLTSQWWEDPPPLYFTFIT